MSKIKVRNVSNQAEVISKLGRELPVFSKEDYLKAKSSIYGWLISDVFILPYIIDKKIIFKRLIFTSTPINFAGNENEDEAMFLRAVIIYLEENKLCDFVGKAQSNCVFKKVPKEINTVPWGSYILNLQQSESELIDGYHKKNRNVIRKAEKEGVKVVFSDSINTVHGNIKETLKRQNSPYFPSLSFLKNLQRDIPDNLLLAAVYKDNSLQGTAVVLYDDKCGYYLYGGSSPQPFTGSVNFLQHCIILHLKSLGLSNYDFVGARLRVEPGSKFEGIQRFKSRFGSELDEGYAFNVIFSTVKFKLYNFAVKSYFFFKGMKYSDPIAQLVEEEQ